MNRRPDSIRKQLLDLVGKDLEGVEAALEANLTPWLELVRDAAGHILFAGGKRLRPLLLLASAKICGSEATENIRFSIIFEYLHAASLLHDDLVDDAKLRRGKPAAQHIFGNETAVLTGDFLLSRALSIAADTRSLEVIRIISEVTEQMSQGEIVQLLNRGRIDLSETEYMEVIRRKTAVLMEAACHVGAVVAQATPAQADALKHYGRHIGMAFQMADDLLDYTSDSTGLGKVVGADLREGKLTLPVIVALKAASSKDRRFMTDIIQSKTFTEEQFHAFSDLLEQYGGIGRTREHAMECISKAKMCLKEFPPSHHKTLLELIATYALHRKV